MIPVLITMVALAAYFVIGWRTALRRRPAFWAVARRDWSCDQTIRESVRARFFWMILLWPVLLPVQALVSRIDAVAEAGDPAALAERITELEAENEHLRYMQEWRG